MSNPLPYVINASLDLFVAFSPVFNGQQPSRNRSFQISNSQVNRISITGDNKVAFCTNPYVFIADVQHFDTNSPIQYSGHQANVMDIAFDDMTFYTCSEDKTWQVWDRRQTKLRSQYRVPTACSLSCLGLFYTKDILLTGNDKGEIAAWSTKERKLIHTLRISQQPIRSIATSKKSNKIIALCQDGNCFALAINDDEIKKIKQFQVHHDVPLRCVISPDENMFVTTSADSTAKLWNFNDYEYIQTLSETDQKKWIWDAAFTADSKYVCTAGTDKYCRTWNTETGEIVYKQMLHPHKGIIAIDILYQ